jgi:hypothetical protein
MDDTNSNTPPPPEIESGALALHASLTNDKADQQHLAWARAQRSAHHPSTGPPPGGRKGMT